MQVLIALLVGCIAVLGWFDDRNNLRIRSRIIVQFVVACGMVYLLARFQGINIAGYRLEQPYWLLFVVLVVWIVWVTNRNTVDNCFNYLGVLVSPCRRSRASIVESDTCWYFDRVYYP